MCNGRSLLQLDQAELEVCQWVFPYTVITDFLAKFSEALTNKQPNHNIVYDRRGASPWQTGFSTQGAIVEAMSLDLGQ